MAVVPTFNFAEKSGDTLDYDITTTGVTLTQPGTEAWFIGVVNRAAQPQVAAWPSKTITNGGVVVTGAQAAVVTLLPTDTENLADGAAVYYAFRVRTAAGRLQTLFEGTITFEIDVDTDVS